MTFLDSNLFVYYVDERDSHKSHIAAKIVGNAIDSPHYLISTQVLNEFANVALRKLLMPEDEAREYVEEFMQIKVVEQRIDWTCKALEIKKRYGLQFYDSLLIAAAEASGCTEILSEDLSDGQIYCGVKVTNPFK